MHELLDRLTDAEFEELIADFTPEQQEKAHFRFRPTKKQDKEFYRMLKHPSDYIGKYF